MTDATKLECGCTHDGARWLSECAAHKAENDEIHAAALQGRSAATWASKHVQVQNLPRDTVIPNSPSTPDWLDIPEAGIALKS